jgi:hypothetical protein
MTVLGIFAQECNNILFLYALPFFCLWTNLDKMSYLRSLPECIEEIKFGGKMKNLDH